LEENREVLEIYHRQLLPQQAQAFRATVIRHYGIGPVEVGAPGGATAYFGDLITAEQNLVSLIGTYLSTLAAYWQAVSDTASLLQTDDAYTMATAVEQFPEANLLELLNLPCCHPCSSLGQAGCSPKAQFVGQGHVELPLARGTAADQVADTDLQPAGDSHKPDCVVEVPTDVPPPHKLRGTLLAPEPDGEALEGGTR
jgi:hypothetical protein